MTVRPTLGEIIVSTFIRAATYRDNVSLNSHVVLRNTYGLLGLSVLFSAICAILSVQLRLPAPGMLLTMAGYYGLLYGVQTNANRSTGLLFVFMLTGFMGYTLGPLLNLLLSSSLGTSILTSALLGTGVSFVALSGYVLSSGKDFGFMQGFLFTGIIGCIIASGVSLIFNVPMIGLMIACAMTMLSSGMILFHTSEIIHGGERNYILATVSLFVTLYNLFISLIQILMAFSGNNRRD